MASNIKQYTQPDQFYVDNYDRFIIKELKDLEKNLPPDFVVQSSLSDTQIFSFIGHENRAISKFFTRAFLFANRRKQVIEGRKQSDVEKDRLIQETVIPQRVLCNQCDSKMNFDSHLFKDSYNERILFVFTCKYHSQKKVVYADGKEYHFKQRRCKLCGATEFKSTSEENKNVLVLTDICQSCGDIEILELEADDEDQTITEEDRKKYCLQFTGISHFFQDLEAINQYTEWVKERDAEKDVKKQFEVDKIKKINVPALEILLKKATEKVGFTKFEFIKTDLSKFAMRTFTALDPTTHSERDSVKMMAKRLEEVLFDSNWRLISNSISYRLGIVTGRIRAYETEDDLLTLAKSIQKKKMKQKDGKK